MKNTTLRITCVLFLSLVCAGLTAQNIPVNLNSGWNWISYPRSEVMSLAAAMSGFTPSPGDVIKGMGGSSMYQNGHWQGSLNVLVPGEGYMYYSIGGTTKSFVFGGSSADASAIPDAALDGEFTVDANGTKVRFSPGNLQCRIDPNKETEATVGLGTGTVTGMPYHTNYKYSLCQMIFKAGELSDAGLAPGTITSLAFESYSPNHFLRTGIQIWMSPTTLNTAPTTSILASTMVLVYSGSLTQQDGWTRVYLNTPFPWDGESNVMVMVVMNHGSYGASTNWQCSNSGFTSCSYKYNDTNSYTPMVNTYASMNTSANRPNVRFFGKGGLVWRFAPEQFESIKNGNGMVSQTYTGWIDLFGWGTSGRSHGASCYQPWSTSTTNSDYNAYNNSSYNLFSQTGEADWGCNAISNGGDQPNQWRTLTKEEWNYLLFTRSTASGKRYAKARIYANNADQYGLILLPDNWSTSYYNLSNTNSASASFTSNTFEPSSWLPLEQHGAVFLPVGGYRYGTSVSNTENGYYYSSSVKDESDVWIYTVKSSESKISYMSRRHGCNVRLVCQSNPRIRTVGVSDLGSSSCIVTGEVDCTGSLTVANRGFCYNQTGNPTISNTCNQVGTGTGGFSTTLTSLDPDKTYYVRAYASVGGTTRYGNVITFHTPDNGSNGHAFVDLDLPSGLLWATCDVGASSPEEYGNNYAWGETQTKSSFSWSNYHYCNGSETTLTKYCTQSDYGNNGFTDYLLTLLPEDDAATVNWGGAWRMPTEAEWQELFNNTTSTWETQNGVKGRRFTASNGNSIFLPSNGSSDSGYMSYRWSSSKYYGNLASGIKFNIYVANEGAVDHGPRCEGRPVRAVLSPR